MSNFNHCESAGDIGAEDFIALVAEEGSSLRVAAILGASMTVRYERIPSPLELSFGVLPPEVPPSVSRERAQECARKILDNECEYYGISDNPSFATFELINKEAI